jgi:hypothetical protein
MSAPRDPVIPLEELRRRYEALGPIREYIGDRSYAGRCADWESFLRYGPHFSDDLAHHLPVGDVPDRYPELVALVEEAWPA